MADIFRIETGQTSLSWSDRSPSAAAADAPYPNGRLAISLPKRARKGISIWRRGLPNDVANNLEVEVGPRLFEDTTYGLLLRGLDTKHIEIRHRDPVVLQTLHSSHDGRVIHGEINFRNEIGRSRFSVYVDGRAEYEFEVEVFPTRLDYAADYSVLIADTEDIWKGFVFEYLRSTFQFGFATDSKHPSSLEWILSLRHVVTELEHGLHYIEQHPHHNLTRERVSTKVERLRRPDATLARMVAQGKGHGPRSRTASGLVLHSRLSERRAQITWDTPEHRWLASQLTRIRRRLAQIQLIERTRTTHNRLRQLQTVDEIAVLENRIAVLQSLEPVAAAKGFVPPNFTSLALQTRPGYREAYRACQVLLEGLRVDGGSVGLSLRDTSSLYEYWCYLALVRMISKITGEQVPVKDLFATERIGLQLQLKRGTSQTIKFCNQDCALELTYNPRYKNGAQILPQQPDVVLTLYDPHRSTLRLVFHTEYDLNPETNYVRQFGSPGPPPKTIDVLHRYRDAILEQTGLQGSRSELLKRTVVEGVALFPYADLQDQFRSTHFWRSLNDFGIGAIPFLPTETRYLEEWLRAVLKRGGWATSEEATLYFSAEQLRSWHEAEKEPVLVAALDRNAADHLEWIKLERCYYTPLNPTQSRQLVSRWIAIHVPVTVRRPSAITHLAEVESFELKKRSEIVTRWALEKSDDEMQIVYRLGEVRELERPIENRGPGELAKRFSRNQWTSRLGIMKATELREIFMETSAEWRLHEQLRLAGVDFILKPAPARVRDENNPDRRVWFAGKHLRVQYRGPAGFLIRRNGIRDQYKSELTDVVDQFTSLT